MPTDTKLNNLVINYLTQAQYDAIATKNENELYLTPDNSTGGEAVSPCLNLTNTVDGVVIPRTSITEEEKTNLEKGLYNSVLYGDSSLGNEGVYMMAFPENLTSNGAEAGFSAYNVSDNEDTGSTNIVGSSMYNLTIGEKSADGTYPIAIEKQFEFTFGKENVTELVIKTLPFNRELNSTDGYNLLSAIPNGENISYAGRATVDLRNGTYITKLIFGLSSNVNQNATGDEEYCHFDCIAKDMGIGRLSFTKASYNVPIFKSFTTWLPPVTSDSEGKALIVTEGNAKWTSIPRYKHVVNLSFEEAGVKKLSAIFTGYNSSNEPVTTYEKLTKLFGGETIELHGKVVVDGTVRDTKYLDLHGGGTNTDNIAYYVGTGNDPLALVTINLDQFNGLTISDDWCLPK